MNIAVNGVEIGEHAINSEMQYHPAATREAARFQAARALVVRELLLQEARRLAIPAPAAAATETPEEAVIAALIAREVRLPEPDEPECRRYFEANRERLCTPAQFEVSHILLVADPADGPARAAARDRAQALIRELQAQPQRFAGLAGRYSGCPSRHAGGSLGRIGKGQTVPEFERALSRMREGGLSTHPVESRYGFHVIHLQRRIDGEPLDFEAVRGRIAGYLRERVRRRALSQYLQILIGRAEITGIALAGSDALVQ